jgi:hypothetical protein
MELNRDHMLCKPITRLFLLIGLVLTGGYIHGMEEKPQEQRPNLNFHKIVHINEKIIQTSEQWRKSHNKVLDELKPMKEQQEKDRKDKEKKIENLEEDIKHTKEFSCKSLNTKLDEAKKISIRPMINNYLVAAACATIAGFGYTIHRKFIQSHLGYLKPSMWFLLGIPSTLFLFQALKKNAILIKKTRNINAQLDKLKESINSDEKNIKLMKDSLKKQPDEIQEAYSKKCRLEGCSQDILKILQILYPKEFEPELKPLKLNPLIKWNVEEQGQTLLSREDAFLLGVMATPEVDKHNKYEYVGIPNIGEKSAFWLYVQDISETSNDMYGHRLCALIYFVITGEKINYKTNFWALQNILKDNAPEVKKALAQYNKLKNTPLPQEGQ